MSAIIQALLQEVQLIGHVSLIHHLTAVRWQRIVDTVGSPTITNNLLQVLSMEMVGVVLADVSGTQVCWKSNIDLDVSRKENVGRGHFDCLLDML